VELETQMRVVEEKISPGVDQRILTSRRLTVRVGPLYQSKEELLTIQTIKK